MKFSCDVISGADESLLDDALERDVAMFSVEAGKSEPKKDPETGNYYRALKDWEIQIDLTKAEQKR